MPSELSAFPASSLFALAALVAIAIGIAIVLVRRPGDSIVERNCDNHGVVDRRTVLEMAGRQVSSTEVPARALLVELSGIGELGVQGRDVLGPKPWRAVIGAIRSAAGTSTPVARISPDGFVLFPPVGPTGDAEEISLLLRGRLAELVRFCEWPVGVRIVVVDFAQASDCLEQIETLLAKGTEGEAPRGSADGRHSRGVAKLPLLT